MGIWGTSENPSNIRLKIRSLVHKFPYLQRAYSSKKEHFIISQGGTEYQKWIEQIETPTVLKILSENPIESFKFQPKISVLIPMYNVKPVYLEKAIMSVIAQKYENWELCINDDCSNLYLEENLQLLKKYQQYDKRIIFKRSDKNENISLSSNRASEMASGEYITFLDNDDELNPYALYFVAKELNQNRKLKFIYTDEDKLSDIEKVDDAQIRKDHVFKPDWSPETMLSLMYTTHLTVIERKTFKKVGGFRVGYEGSQDYDLALRVTELLNPAEEIFHIPYILYHWRTVPSSTANLNPIYKDKKYGENKSKVVLSSLKSVEDALKRRKIDAKVEQGLSELSHKIIYSKKKNPVVDIIIATKNKYELLDKCLKSIKEKSSYKNYFVTIVDNGSDEQETIDYLKTIRKQFGGKFTLLQYNIPYNFSAINNWAVKKLPKRDQDSQIIFLNNDIEVISEDWIEAMLNYSMQKEIGAVGALLLYPNGTIQHAGLAIGTGEVLSYIDNNELIEKRNLKDQSSICVASEYHKYYTLKNHGYMDRIKIAQNVSAVTGACLMIKRVLFNKLGCFDEINFGINYNDVDLCLKALDAGYRNIYTPFAQLYHYESISRKEMTQKTFGTDIYSHNIHEFREKWKKYVQNDPYYNPNFSRKNANFQLL